MIDAGFAPDFPPGVAHELQALEGKQQGIADAYPDPFRILSQRRIRPLRLGLDMPLIRSDRNEVPGQGARAIAGSTAVHRIPRTRQPSL